MSDQYELEAIVDLAFEREPAPVRGSIYRCKVCDKRPIKIKGVLTELTGKERTSFKQKFNAMHRRHAASCTTRSEIAAVEMNPSGEAPDGRTDAGGGNGAGGTGLGEAGIGSANGPSTDSEEDEPPPPPLNPTAIGHWTALLIRDAMLHGHPIPATMEAMVYIPQRIGCAKVQCFLRNEYGVVSLRLGGPLVCMNPALRAQYQAAEARWRGAEHQTLVNLFERACAHASSEAVRVALEQLLAKN